MTDGRAERSGSGSAGAWLARARRRVRQWRGTEPRTRVQIRCEQTAHGGWHVCPYVLQPGDIAYSFGRGTDLVLERALLEDYQARVYIFDPDPAVAERAEAEGLLDAFQLYAVQVGPENRPAEPDRGIDGARMVRLASVMRMLGHRRLDLVKLGEDAAPAAIADLVALDVDVRQLLVDMPATESTEARDRVEARVQALEGHGFRIFHIDPDGRRYSFIRTDFGEP